MLAVDEPARAQPHRMRLTEQRVEKLKPTGRHFLVWDAGQRGLAVQVRPSGRRIFKVIYTFNGRTRWYNVGAGVKLEDARRLAQEILYKVAQGIDPAAQRRAQRSSGTFEELADRHLEYAKTRNKSWAQADALVRNHLRPRWGKLLAAEISRADVRAVVTKVASHSTANQVLAAASAIFSWAIREELGGITTNPCQGVERYPTTDRERVLSASELPSFWRAFDDAGLIRGTALKVLLFTGQRPGEVACMRREHIVDGWWTLPGAPVVELGWPGTKNGATHRVWLPKPVVKLLTELGEDTAGFVFPGERGGAVKSLSKAMQEICVGLECERTTPHDLRRTHGSTVTAMGFGRDAMNRIQNHREGGIADVYDRHSYDDENQRIMEAVAARLVALATGTKATNNVVQLR
jgi:integrase